MKKLWVIDLTFFAPHYDDGQELAAREVALTKAALIVSMESLKACKKPHDLLEWSIFVEEYQENPVSDLFDYQCSWTWRPGVSNTTYPTPPWSTDGLLALGTWSVGSALYLL